MGTRIRIFLALALACVMLGGPASGGVDLIYEATDYKLNVGIAGDEDPLAALEENDDEYLSIGSKGIGDGKRRVKFTTTHTEVPDTESNTFFHLDGKTTVTGENCDLVIKAYHWKRKRYVRVSGDDEQLTDTEGPHLGFTFDRSPYVNGTNKVKVQWICTRSGAFNVQIDHVSVTE